MAGTSSYTGININSDYRFNIVDLLTQIPDNASHLINAKDVRDSVWTLWNRIDDVQITASQSLSDDTSYLRSTPTISSIGGVSIGTTFSGTIQDALDIILYPYIAPTATLSASNNQRQFGSSTSVTLTWSVIKKKNNITSIIVDGSTIIPTGVNQNSTRLTTSTHSSNPISSNIVQSYTMSVGDGTSNTIVSTSITWLNRVYWGKVNLSSIGNPDLTTQSGSASSVGNHITDGIIKSLSGAGVSPGFLLTSTYGTSGRTYAGINGSGEYLVFAHPTIFGSVATFTVNGLSSNAFTKVRSDSTFSNEFGFTGLRYDVYVSNTAQNSPLDIIIKI